LLPVFLRAFHNPLSKDIWTWSFMF
jgi:hypothetical protein